MTISAALEEAYASGDEEGVTLTAAEIDHPGFDEPIYVVRGADDLDGETTIDLPLVEGGPKVPHKAVPFALTRPGADKDGPTEGKIRIDNVSDQLEGPLKQALGYEEPILITFRQYRILPGQLALVTGPDEEIPGLLLSDVQLGYDAAEGTVAYPDGRMQNVPTGPDAFFDRETYPGLF